MRTESTIDLQLEPADISKLPDWQQTEPMAHLQAWFNENHPKKEMIWKEGYSRQIMFVRDNFMKFFHKTLVKMEVISTHTSKSIKLPVYRVEIEGIEFIMRDNFHDWKVSVDSKTKLKLPLELFSYPDKQIEKHYCEGFNNEWIYEPYCANEKKFTVEIYNDQMLFTFLFLIKIQLENSLFFQK